MTRAFDRVSLFFLLLRLLHVAGMLDFFELNNAQYDFDINTTAVIFDEIPEDNDTFITLANKNGQKFACTLPERPTPMEKDLNAGSSVNPMIAADQIAKNLGKCIKLKSGWWTYTLCPRKSITQSHGRESDSDFVSLSLGMFTGKYAMPTTMSASEGEKMLYLEEKYDMGAVCDITGTPRSTVVHYTCEPQYTAKEAMIHSVDEEASCEYKIEVRTGALCSIVQFQPPKPPQTQPIKCNPILTSIEAAVLKKSEEIKDKNKEKANRELAMIKQEYEETKVRRWSIERRRMEFNHEKFDLKMRDLDEDYIDLTRDQLEWNVIAKTGEEPTAEIKETIHELLDSMEAIETPQVFYNSIPDEDRANLWYYFHNPKWRSDGFPLLLNEVDLRNGFVMHINEIIEKGRLTWKQEERLKRLIEFGHPSRIDSFLTVMGADGFKMSLARPLSEGLSRALPGSIPIRYETALTMTIEDIEKKLREGNRHAAKRTSFNDLLDIFCHFWAMHKITEIDPLRDDAIWHGSTGLETITVAETIDRLQRAWEFFEFMEISNEELAAGTKANKDKYAQNRAGIDRVRRAEGDFGRYLELLERERDPADRTKNIDYLTEKVEWGGAAVIDYMKSFHWDTVRHAHMERARVKIPLTNKATTLQNDLGQDMAIAVFRDNIDAHSVIEQLEQAGLGGETVKLHIHVKDGHSLSSEQNKIIIDMLQRELIEAKTRERTKQRKRAYDYVYKEQDNQLL